MKSKQAQKKGRILLLILFLLLIVPIVGFLLWSQNTYSAVKEEGIIMTGEGEKVDDWLVFEAEQTKIGLILYPGAKVDANAYAYVGQELAKQKITVAIPNVRFNLPIFDQLKAEEILKNPRFHELDWYIGGHSMGGAAASMFADANLDRLSGLILLGAYAADNEALSVSTFPVLTISGSEDGLSTPQKIIDYGKNLPKTTQTVEIQGGNHAQFGVYGSQSGDYEATISVQDQQQIMIDTIVNWITAERATTSSRGDL
ncbi:alpha/beta family hydrolase [Shouchella sp. 1P09AA]|uniref:alpha/beta family hydrolase n=1 Tax=unclassified Shouchella TaxID=2893065 RepID=UPI0039A3E4BB